MLLKQVQKHDWMKERGAFLTHTFPIILLLDV